MFENIQIEELIERLTRTTDEREAMAERASNDTPFVSGKALWMAARFAGHFRDTGCIKIQDNLVVVQDVNASHVAMYNLTLGSHEPLVLENQMQSSVQNRLMKDFVSKHKKHSKKHTDVVEIDEKLERLLIHDGSGESTELSLTPTSQHAPKLPCLDLETVLENVDLNEFRTALKAVKFITEISTFHYEPNNEDLVLTAKGINDNITAKVSVVPTDVGAKAQYATDFLKPIQWLNKETQLNISYSNNMPLRIDFKGEEAGTIYSGFIFLAPRVDQDY